MAKSGAQGSSAAWCWSRAHGPWASGQLDGILPLGLAALPGCPTGTAAQPPRWSSPRRVNSEAPYMANRWALWFSVTMAGWTRCSSLCPGGTPQAERAADNRQQLGRKSPVNTHSHCCSATVPGPLGLSFPIW